MKIVIPGIPMHKERHRTAKAKNGKTWQYNPQRAETKSFITNLIKQIGRHDPITGGVIYTAFYYFPVPDSASPEMRELMLSGDIPHIVKPDLDNLNKFAWDCFNKIVWKDDSQVVGEDCVKQYGEEPQSIIFVKEV